MLAYQFVVGLQQELKVKVAGVDEELWTKARFEEAKIRDLDLKSNGGRKPNPPPPPPRKDGDKPPTEGGGPKSIRCYHCHGTGHIAKNCPLRGRGTPNESAERNAKGKGKGPRVGNVRADEETYPKIKSEVVAELRRALQEAELEETSATLWVVKTTPDHEKEKKRLLGLTLSAVVKFEGTEVQVLLDTGSPVTIVPLGFLLKILVKRKKKEQDAWEWKEEVRRRLSPSELVLRNYGGGELNVIKQMTATIRRGEHECETTVLVQKGSPLDLLVGTDVQPLLGFLVLQTEGAKAVDILKESWVLTKQGSQGPQVEESDSHVPMGETEGLESLPFADEAGVVHLLTATRLPARHGKVIHACIGGRLDTSPLLFESARECLRERGLSIEDAVTQPDEDGRIALVIHNHSLLSASLEEGER